MCVQALTSIVFSLTVMIEPLTTAAGALNAMWLVSLSSNPTPSMAVILASISSMFVFSVIELTALILTYVLVLGVAPQEIPTLVFPLPYTFTLFLEEIHTFAPDATESIVTPS